MKRSEQIGLAAVGVVLVATAWSLVRGSGEEETLVYNSISECRAGGVLSATQCEQRFNEASADHLRESRKFGSNAECEAQYGPNGCRGSTWNNAQVFVPALAGIMLARSLAQGGGTAQPLLPPTREACPPGSQAQECQQARSSTSSGGGGGGGSRSRAYSTPSGQAVVARNVSSTGVASVPRVASRGGFGSTSRAFSSSSSS